MILLNFKIKHKNNTNSHIVKYIKSFLTEQNFRVSDTELSYRQINNLHTNRMLPENRKSNSEWRRFSIRDLVYLKLVNECRLFGMENKQLRGLKTVFYKAEVASISKGELNVKMKVADYCLMKIIEGGNLRLQVFSTGEILLTDNSDAAVKGIDQKLQKKSRLDISLNEVFNCVMKDEKWKKFEQVLPESKKVVEKFIEYR